MTERVYKDRCRQKEVGKTIMKNFIAKNDVHNLKTSLQADENLKFVNIEGRRIVHIETLGKQLYCRICKSVLSLSKIVSEKQNGLASQFSVECDKCKAVTGVYTDKQHHVSKQNAHFDTNTKNCYG